jgi:hypothetical protein
MRLQCQGASRGRQTNNPACHPATFVPGRASDRRRTQQATFPGVTLLIYHNNNSRRMAGFA